MSDQSYDEVSATPHPQVFDLERELFTRFSDLHTRHPHHEIFGEPVNGMPRLPLYASLSADQTWADICRRIALMVSDQMRRSFGPSECWFSRTRKLRITNEKVKVKDVQIVRLLAFLAAPTPLHWTCLVERGCRVRYKPYSHLCWGQHQTSDGKIAYCINGLYHGTFATGNESESGRIGTNSVRLSAQPFAEICPSARHSPRLQLEQHLLQLFINLHTSDPEHEIFGEPGQDLVRLPLYSSGNTDQSWAKVCRSIALCVVTEMKSSFQFQGCWMAHFLKVRICKTSNRRLVTYKNVMIVRLLAFLADPTPLHWAYLTENGFEARYTPFSHWCNRGCKRSDGQVAFCINGLYHGRFATVAENASHQYCGNGARPICPGHGRRLLSAYLHIPMAR
ncbi:hypothetical protein V1505DRAFT_154281 [Lipomyces doorenjongii]